MSSMLDGQNRHPRKPLFSAMSTNRPSRPSPARQPDIPPSAPFEAAWKPADRPAHRRCREMNAVFQAAVGNALGKPEISAEPKPFRDQRRPIAKHAGLSSLRLEAGFCANASGLCNWLGILEKAGVRASFNSSPWPMPSKTSRRCKPSQYDRNRRWALRHGRANPNQAQRLRRRRHAPATARPAPRWRMERRIRAGGSAKS